MTYTTSCAENRFPPRVAIFLLLAVVALGFFLRIHRIDAEGLWIDEAFSVWLARKPFGEMLRWIARIDQHPPLYYALLHGWLRLVGDGEFAVRALSAFFGAATIPVIYALGRRLVDERVGLLSALILALSPFHMRFAQEARMYTLLTLEASLALLAVSSCVVSSSKGSEPRTSNLKRTAVVYAIFTAAALWTHNTAIFLFLALNLAAFGLLFSRLRNTQYAIRNVFLHHWLLPQAAVLLLWLPWLPAFVRQSVGVLRRFWLPAPTWETVVGAVGALLIDFLPFPLVGTIAVTVALGALAIWGLARLRGRAARAVFLLTFFVTPFVGEWLVSLWRPIFYARTLIWASIPLYVMLAAGVCWLRGGFGGRRRFLAALVILGALNGLALREYYAHFEKEQWDDAAALVAGRARLDDLILFNATWGQIPFDYYFHQLSHCPVEERGAPVDLFKRDLLEPRMTGSDLPRLHALVRDRDRVWLIYSHAWYTDPQGLIPRALGEDRAVLGRWEFRGVEVRLYGPL